MVYCMLGVSLHMSALTRFDFFFYENSDNFRHSEVTLHLSLKFRAFNSNKERGLSHCPLSSVADPERFDADPGPTFLADADPDKICRK